MDGRGIAGDILLRFDDFSLKSRLTKEDMLTIE